jgi:hypothetical protein
MFCIIKVIYHRVVLDQSLILTKRNRSYSFKWNSVFHVLPKHMCLSTSTTVKRRVAPNAELGSTAKNLAIRQLSFLICKRLVFFSFSKNKGLALSFTTVRIYLSVVSLDMISNSLLLSSFHLAFLDDCELCDNFF